MKQSLLAIPLLISGLITIPNGMAQDKTSEHASVSVTGCLAQGDQANEYTIKDASGKTYGLMSSQVNLKPHIGHTVTITGVPVKPTEGSAKSETKTTQGDEGEHLRVTNLKMVSTSCQ